MLTWMTTASGDTIFLLVLWHWEGIRALVTIFPSSWKFVKPDHLDFDPEPCRAGLPQVPTGADPTHSSGGVQFAQWAPGASAINRSWGGKYCFCGCKESDQVGQWIWIQSLSCLGLCIGVFVHFSVWIFLSMAGGQEEARQADTHLLLSPISPVLPRLCTCCLLPFAQNLSFRRKIAVHRNFHNALRGLVSFLQWYVNSPPWSARKEASEETSHTTHWVRTHSTLIIIYLTLGKKILL